MREQLIQYIDLLFAGSSGTEDIKQEILQNTLDRFDDLVAGGKAPEAAYSLAISGIGDIGEILNGAAQPSAASAPASAPVTAAATPAQRQKNKLLRAIAIGLYIICAVPLFIIQDEIGLCLTLVVVAAATILMVMTSAEKKNEAEKKLSPGEKLRKSISSIVCTVGLVIYFFISFTTMAWHITWLIFPICAAIDGLVSAIMDLKEAKSHEE